MFCCPKSYKSELSDDGVQSFESRVTQACGYNALFPASSPYVTAVGATQVVCYSTFVISIPLHPRHVAEQFLNLYYRAPKREELKELVRVITAVSSLVAVVFLHIFRYLIGSQNMFVITSTK